ncbi:MAG: hypothetical protein BAA04_04475 [Firmicutes bacterium ZCTH02-B6]|nr:MAG: hypothetical protein BAA04_04475 [Firmicutes bacterium ZCTH02-B6]
MRYSDLAGKEIIDIDQGIRLGVINDTDLVIDTDAGKVVAIIIPSRGGWWARRELEIPWHGIRKIGVDLIIVDLSTATTLHDRERLSGAGGGRRRVWDLDASEPDLR